MTKKNNTKRNSNELVHSFVENKENKRLAKLKRTMQWVLQLLRLATGVTLFIFLIIPVVLILVVPILVFYLAFAVVCLPIIVLSAPLIWFFASKNNKKLIEHQKISDTPENGIALPHTFQEESTDRKNISNVNSNGTDASIKKCPFFFTEEKPKLPDDSQNQFASASISKSL